MARTPRIFFSGAIYHVYCRTARGEMVFSDLFGAGTFVETVADVKRLHGFLVPDGSHQVSAVVDLIHDRISELS